jgi:hypothetical protein
VAQEVVTFVEEGDVPSVGVSSRRTRGYYIDAEDELANSVVGFLSRPTPIANFVWQSNTGVISSLANVVIPNDYIKQPMIKEKLQGFRYLRCDFKFKLQINAQPFNAGRMILVFNPYETMLGLAPSNFIHFGGLTGYRHVQLDLAESTAVELTVPFMGPMSHFDLVTAANSLLGTVRVIVYSPLTGSDDVDCTLWMWAENIDIQMPTGLPISSSFAEPHFSVRERWNNARLESGLAQANGRKGRGNREVTNTDAPVNIVSFKPLLDRVAEKEQRPGTVETAARATGRFARNFLAVPFLGAYARTLTWMTDAIAATASIFGWSKPNDPEYDMSIQYRYNTHLAHYNGDVKGKILSLDAKNETDIPAEIFCTEQDEMAIKTIVTRPTYLDRFKFDKTKAQNDLLWKWPVDATSCLKDDYNTNPGGVGEEFIRSYHNYVSYVSRLFRYWRGSLCYTFKLVKTPFHTGRIQVIWVPGAQQSTDLSTVDISKCYSEIHDLRQVTQFDYCVPFTWNLPWKDSEAVNFTPATCWDTPTGMIYVRVINALRNPSTCADSIDIIVETRAGEDFQVAYPMICDGRYGGSEMGDLEVSNGVWCRANLPTLESGRAQAAYDSEENADPGINALGMGEVVTSFRQVLRRYERIAQNTSSTSPHDSKMFGGSSNVIRPYLSSWNDGAVGTHDVAWDYFSRVLSLFRFMCGGMRLYVAGQPNSSSSDQPNAMYYGEVPGNTSQKFALDTGDAPEEQLNIAYAAQVGPFEPVVELELPYYSFYPVTLTTVGLPPTSNYVPLTVNNNTGPGVRVQTAASHSPLVMRAIGEDFSFGYLIGAPVTFLARHNF